MGETTLSCLQIAGLHYLDFSVTQLTALRNVPKQATRQRGHQFGSVHFVWLAVLSHGREPLTVPTLSVGSFVEMGILGMGAAEPDEHVQQTAQSPSVQTESLLLAGCSVGFLALWHVDT